MASSKTLLIRSNGQVMVVMDAIHCTLYHGAFWQSPTTNARPPLNSKDNPAAFVECVVAAVFRAGVQNPTPFLLWVLQLAFHFVPQARNDLSGDFLFRQLMALLLLLQHAASWRIRSSPPLQNKGRYCREIILSCCRIRVQPLSGWQDTDIQSESRSP